MKYVPNIQKGKVKIHPKDDKFKIVIFCTVIIVVILIISTTFIIIANQNSQNNSISQNINQSVTVSSDTDSSNS